MSYRNKKITRLVQKHLLALTQQIRFKTAHITQAGKIIFLGVALCFISLFQTWISVEDTLQNTSSVKIDAVSSFSGLVGYVGIFLLLIFCVILFGVFSLRKKERFHFFSMIQLTDWVCALYGSMLTILFCIQTFLFIGGLQTFSGNILYGKGIILCITGAIVVLFGSLLLKKEYRKNIKGSYMSELRSGENMSDENEQKNNMKLPF